jgi:hypothetical protein
VNPPTENPWRTREDYLEEQRRGKIQFRITIATMVVSVLGVVATATIAIESLKRMSETHGLTIVNQSQNTEGIDQKLFAKAETELKQHIEYLKSGKSGVLRWGAIRGLRYEFHTGDSDSTISAVLTYDEDFSVSGIPFTKYARYELYLVFAEDKWWLTGGVHRFFAPEGEENPFPNWTQIADDNIGIRAQLQMDFLKKQIPAP